MPSDDRVQLALQAVARRRDAFQSALQTTIAQVDTVLGQSRGTDGRVERVTLELGPFAGERIDAARFSSLFDATTLDGLRLEAMQRARETLGDLTKQDGALFLADVSPGRDLRAAVAHALEEIGRAFGAVRTFELTRAGRSAHEAHGRSLGSFPFTRWSRGERRLAPPLVVTVDGGDLRVGGLAEFLDGTQQIVLVVRGECAPAPLVRLITPGTFTMQTNDPADLVRLTSWDGPGVAALVPDGAARFVHDPAGGAALWQRLTVSHLPEGEPKRAIGGISAAQQADELRQLVELVARPPAPPAPTAEPSAQASAPADPADKLAAWLLSQADLTDLE